MAHIAVVDLAGHSGVAHYRPCDKLGKHRDIQQQIGVAALGHGSGAVYIDKIGYALEGVEADTDGESHRRYRHCDAHCTQLLCYETRIFKHTYHNHIDRKTGDKRKTAPDTSCRATCDP